MAVGSAFDAKVKSFLVEKLIGKRPQFEYQTLFEAQVEPHNRDEAEAAGRAVFDAYTRYGALADIVADLQHCIGEPRFEASIEGKVFVSGIKDDVPFLGKPDIYFITKDGGRVIFDWKVNNYYGKSAISPKPGYARLRQNGPESGRQHPKAMVMPLNGIRCTVNFTLDSVEAKWAAQTAIYAWLLGENVGAQFITAIDQIVVNKTSMGMRDFRIAQHRSTITEKFQRDLFRKAHEAWTAIKAGNPFFDEPEDIAREKMLQLDEFAFKRMQSSGGGQPVVVDR